MVFRLNEFSLALGVIDNILICNHINRIIFAGDEIRKRLFQPGVEPECFLLENFSDARERQALKSKITEARINRSTCFFRFQERGINLFIFPGSHIDRDCVILATEDQILQANNIESALKERVKELQCLYNISNELESSPELEKALENCTGHLVRGFQYPQYATVGFLLDGLEYGDPDCKTGCDIIHRLWEDVVIAGKNRGRISVCYHRRVDFLDEEKKLLKEVALMIARALEKDESRRYLNHQQDLLISKNHELLQLTQDLMRSNTNLQAVLNAITDIVVVVDRNFNITISNKEGLEKEGKCYKAIFGSETICPDCPALPAFDKAAPISIEKKHNHQYYWLQAYPIMNGTCVDTVLEICSDITEKEQMKTHLIQSYKLASLGKLVAGVAHEINNPNTFIRGNINIVKEAMYDILPLLDQAYEKDPGLKIARLPYTVFRENIPLLIDDMTGGADRIKKIVDDLRNFARKDEGLMTDDIDLNHLIKNNLRITEKHIRKNARLDFFLAPDVPVFKGNSQKFEQVLLNMLINASQAIENTNGVIRVSTRYQPDSHEVLLIISDNGKGMNEDTRKKIFDPFFTTKRNKGGTGLGLSITYGIIKEHKGKIEVESQENEGTTFTIRIPVTQNGKI